MIMTLGMFPESSIEELRISLMLTTLCRFIWSYKRQLLGMSEATIEWHVSSDVERGTYRLGYFGNSIAPFSKYVE